MADGNIGDKFAMQTTGNGKVYVAQPLDWEQQSYYSLNISITDGCNTIYTQVLHISFSFFCKCKEEKNTKFIPVFLYFVSAQRMCCYTAGNYRTGCQRSRARLLRTTLPCGSVGERRSGHRDHHFECDRRRPGQARLLCPARRIQRLLFT